MLKLLSFLTAFSLLLLPSTSTIINIDAFSTNESVAWAEVTASILVGCYYDSSTGLWSEAVWQSGSTLESIANVASHIDFHQRYIFNETFRKTDPFVGSHCYDDYQYWLLAWIQVYQVDPNIEYLHRANVIYNTLTKQAWKTTPCGGGLQQCSFGSYKNAITNELFLLSSMRLHPYAKLLGRSSTYYLDWALKEWQWFEQSGMINSGYLINDGLRSSEQSSTGDVNFPTAVKCVNNNGTTWTYTQGVILSGLALLYNTTHNSTLLTIAQNIADAAIEQLTYPNGILREPCEPNCDSNQKLYKGIFARHLGYLLPYLKSASHIKKYRSFLRLNAESLWLTDRCEEDGLFGLLWNTKESSECDSTRSVATTSAAIDLFIAAAEIKEAKIEAASEWTLLGLGSCMDNHNASMPNYYTTRLTERGCRTSASEDKGAVAYDFQLDCNSPGAGFCRIRTLSGRQRTPPGFDYEDGSARTVTGTNEHTNEDSTTYCFLKMK